jgi:hypothetical protein
MSRHPISEVKDKVDFTLNVAGINVLSQVGSNPSFLNLELHILRMLQNITCLTGGSKGV